MLKVHGNLLVKRLLTGVESVVRIEEANVDALYVYVNHRRAKVKIHLDGQEYSFTADELGERELYASDFSALVKGIPLLIVYDDTSNTYIVGFKVDSHVKVLEISIESPEKYTIQYAYQVVEEVRE